jgi:molecular chaperone Hsp33
MPGVSDQEAERLTGRIRGFGPVTSRVAAGQGPTEWLEELFPEGVEQLETTATRFVCGCSTERVETALKLLGADELSGLVASADDRPTTLTCGFCHTPYQVTRVKLTELLAEIERETLSG